MFLARIDWLCVNTNRTKSLFIIENVLVYTTQPVGAYSRGKPQI